MVRLFGFIRAASYWAEDQFDWLLRNPVFPAQILLLLLASWGLLGAKLGVEHLFWSDSWAVQFGCGLAVGMQFGVVLYVWYMLDKPQRSVIVTARWGRPTLFPSKTDYRLRWVGSYLLWALLLLLVAVIGGKALVVASAYRTKPPFHLLEYLSDRNYLVFGIAGYLSSLLLARVLFVLDERLGIRDRIAKGRLFQMLPGFTSGRIPAGDVAIHAVSAYLVVICVLFLMIAAAALLIVNWFAPGRVITSPIFLVCLVFILFTQLYGYWSRHVRLGTLTLVVVVLALDIWNSAGVFPEANYKLHFPGLDDYYDPPNRVRLDELDLDGRPHKFKSLRRDCPLLEDENIIDAIDRRWRATRGGEQSRPKIILIATSGGGIRSAVWTAVVLEGLEREMPGAAGPPMRAAFRNHIRLFTGASGGMLGASLYVADFDRNWSDRGNPAVDPEDGNIGLGVQSGSVAEQSLLPVFQTAVIRDFSRNLLVPSWLAVTDDRGRALEEKWALNARARGYGPAGTTAGELAALREAGHRLSPFNRTFADLYPLEAEGLRPSLIFSPMLVEDSRRLLVSNLDLGSLAAALGPVVRTPGELSVRVDGHYSRSGLELFKLFPESHSRFEVGTAARMSATFPVISPAVNLPTTPPRRVVDAGYFDNYGVDLVAMWLFRNRKVLQKHVGGVALIEIRAYPFQDRGLAFYPNGSNYKEAGGLLTDALAALNTPLQAILSAQGNVAYHRNNELLAALDDSFNTYAPKHSPVFRRFVFELDTDASLNWYLSRGEKARIASWYATSANRNEAKALSEWLGDGGGPPW